MDNPINPGLTDTDANRYLEGIVEGYEAPARTVWRGVKHVVRNYWDLGLTVLGAYAFCDTGNQHLGVYREYLMAAGLFASTLGANGDMTRFARNVYGGMAGLCWWWAKDIPAVPARSVLLNKVCGVGMAALTIYVDRTMVGRHQAKPERS